MGESEHKASGARIILWVFICLLAALILAAVIVPNFIYVPTHHYQNACINNLRQIDAGKNEWALENEKTNGSACTENDIKAYVKLPPSGEFYECPQGGTFTIGKIGESPTCSLGKAKPGHVLP